MSLFADDSLDGLLDFSEHVEALSPAFGLVYRMAAEWRLMVLLGPRTFPTPTEGGPTIGDLFYVHISKCDLGSLAAMAAPGVGDSLDVQGWLFTGSGWAVPGAPAAYKGRLARHPQRERVLQSVYLDQRDGWVLSRTQFLSNGAVDTRMMEYPRAGWTLRNAGSVVAALQRVRSAASDAR